MKKIINGKCYNTETAQEICGYYNCKSWNDFDVYSIDLYKTKKGAFFSVERTYFKTNFEILSEKEARAFVEEYGDAEDYANTFGEPEEA